MDPETSMTEAAQPFLLWRKLRPGARQGLARRGIRKGINILYEGDASEWLNAWPAPAVTFRSKSGVPDGAGAEHRPGDLILLLLEAP